MRRREEEWLAAERPRNEACLREMRRLVPPNLPHLSRQEIQAAAEQAYSRKGQQKPAEPPAATPSEPTPRWSQSSSTPADFEEFYPTELAAYFKDTTLLHWLVMDPENEIRRANFLIGDSAKHFNNLERFDIVELRAVVRTTPLALAPH